MIRRHIGAIEAAPGSLLCPHRADGRHARPMCRLREGWMPKRLSRQAREGWVRKVRRGLYIGVPVDASNPAAWSEDALIVAARV